MKCLTKDTYSVFRTGVLLTSIISSTAWLPANNGQLVTQHELDTVTFDTQDIAFGTGYSNGLQIFGNKKFDGTPVYNNFTYIQQNLPAIFDTTDPNWDKEYLKIISDAPGREIRMSFGHDMAVQYTPEGIIQRDNDNRIVYDNAAFDKVEQIINSCHEQGKQVMLCLFHHTWPTGTNNEFEYGFADDAYTQEWLAFARSAVDRFGQKVDQWMPFNEPTGYISAGYIAKKYPPYLKAGRLGGKALENILKAQQELRTYILQTTNNQKIGTVEQVRLLFPARWWHPLDRLTAHIGNQLAVDQTLEYYKTGILSWGIAPALCSHLNWVKQYEWGKWFFKTISSGYLDHSDIRATNQTILDFAAVSYYTSGQMRGTTYEDLPGYEQADNGSALYPQGLCTALDKFDPLVQTGAVNTLKIGEIGCNLDPEKRDNECITTAYKQLLYQAYKYIQDGGTLDAIHFWSTFNTYEWPKQNGAAPELSHYGMIEKSTVCLQDIVHLMALGTYLNTEQ